MKPQRRQFLHLAAGAAAFPAVSRIARAQAQSTVKIGALLPMTGPQQPTGVQVAAGMRLYMAQHGDTVGGKKVQVLFKDDGGVADNSKRLAQEMIGDRSAVACAPLVVHARLSGAGALCRLRATFAHPNAHPQTNYAAVVAGTIIKETIVLIVFSLMH
jgi:hypothetical protein